MLYDLDAACHVPLYWKPPTNKTVKLVAEATLNSDPSKIIKELHLLIKKLNLKEILCDDWETLSMVCNSLQIWVLIQDVVIDVQEKLERVLVQEMYLKDKRVCFFSL